MAAPLVGVLAPVESMYAPAYILPAFAAFPGMNAGRAAIEWAVLAFLVFLLFVGPGTELSDPLSRVPRLRFGTVWSVPGGAGAVVFAVLGIYT